MITVLLYIIFLKLVDKFNKTDRRYIYIVLIYNLFFIRIITFILDFILLPINIIVYIILKVFRYKKERIVL